MEVNKQMFLLLLGVGSIWCWGNGDNLYGPSNLNTNNDNTESGYYHPPPASESEYNGGEHHSKVDLSHFNIGLLLGDTVDFEGDNSDIDDFDFSLDELDKETEIDISANEIKAVDWVPILENYIEVLSKGKKNSKTNYKIRKANELKNLEEELVRRGKEDFEDEEPEKETCTKMEYNVLTHIHSLPVDQQKIVLDVDRDGTPDFAVVDVHDKLGLQGDED